MIKVENLVYSYNGKDTLTFPDFSCQKGELLLLLGESGVGKSTLLHLLGGLMQAPDSNILIDKTNLNQLSSSQLDLFRGRNIGIIFQTPHFVKSISVVENLLLAQSLAGVNPNRQRCMKLLEDLGIAYKADDRPKNLSQGEKQRLSIARAIINRPKVILADEPTSALDDKNTNQVVNLLRKEAEEIDAALIIVTHDTRLKDIIPNQVTLHK